MKSEAVVFENKSGQKLFAVMQEPEQVTSDVGIILLPPGVKMRVAPHRLYLDMAERFLELGFVVFRMDFNGLGDSEGEHTEVYLADLYNEVQNGRFVDDTLAGIEYLAKKSGVKRFILSGLCGGAITGLLAGEMDKRVIGVLGLGLPIIFDVSESDRYKYLTKGQIENYKYRYIKKLFSLKAWFRLLSVKSDYKTMAVILKQLLGQKKQESTQVVVTDAGESTIVGNVNPRFSPAFFNLLQRSGNILLIFSGADRLQWEFQEKFYDPNRSALERFSDYFSIHTVENANHIFSENNWKAEMLSVSEGWLKKHYLENV
ncbi:MAG: hypothetical protein OEZ68_00370 [Gammaproteobacteria bacterium]|nr:hypothetical protein [Gammaproteobacteria bacterium]MDH5799233.1 hypothetical protein [Gammaproteobacteria bacterium]